MLVTKYIVLILTDGVPQYYVCPLKCSDDQNPINATIYASKAQAEKAGRKWTNLYGEYQVKEIMLTLPGVIHREDVSEVCN